MDSIEITITETGLFKISTDAVSAPNHSLAEGMVRKMAELAGGKTTRTLKPNAKAHTHHGHTHSHGAGGHSHSH